MKKKTVEEQVKVVMDSDITEPVTKVTEVTETKVETEVTEVTKKKMVIDTKYRLRKLELVEQLFTTHVNAAIKIAKEVLPNNPIMEYLEELVVFDAEGKPFSSLNMKKEIILNNEIYSSKVLRYLFINAKKNLETLFNELPKPLTPCTMCKQIPTKDDDGLIKCSTEGCYFHKNVPPMDEETWNEYMN